MNSDLPKEFLPKRRIYRGSTKTRNVEFKSADAKPFTVSEGTQNQDLTDLAVVGKPPSSGVTHTFNLNLQDTIREELSPLKEDSMEAAQNTPVVHKPLKSSRRSSINTTQIIERNFAQNSPANFEKLPISASVNIKRLTGEINNGNVNQSSVSHDNSFEQINPVIHPKYSNPLLSPSDGGERGLQQIIAVGTNMVSIKTQQRYLAMINAPAPAKASNLNLSHHSCAKEDESELFHPQINVPRILPQLHLRHRERTFDKMKLLEQGLNLKSNYGKNSFWQSSSTDPSASINGSGSIQVQIQSPASNGRLLNPMLHIDGQYSPKHIGSLNLLH